MWGWFSPVSNSWFCVPSTRNLLLLPFFNVKDRIFVIYIVRGLILQEQKSDLFFYWSCSSPLSKTRSWDFGSGWTKKWLRLDFILFPHCLWRIWALKMVSGDWLNIDRFCEYGLLRGADRTSWSMLCCGGAEEESSGPPASQYTAPPRGSTYGGGGGNIFIFVILFFMQYVSFLCKVMDNDLQ